MIKLKEIIGWEEAKPESYMPEIEDCRPDFCPACNAPARKNGLLQLVGHGSYLRWVYFPVAVKISVRRFRCKPCRRTTSVLPHWLLPRFQYPAPLILLSLKSYYLAGRTAFDATCELTLGGAKERWAALRRWGAAFLLHCSLWGWLGPQLGVRPGSSWSRDRVRIHLERFLKNFEDRAAPWEAPTIDEIVRLSLEGMVFSEGKARSGRHAPRGRGFASATQKARFAVPTQGRGSPKAPT